MQNYFSIQFLWVVKSLWRVSNKIPLSMRLLILFLVCSIGLCYASDSYAQKTLISIDVHNQRVEDILKEIEEQSDFDFFFNNKHVDLNHRLLPFRTAQLRRNGGRFHPHQRSGHGETRPSESQRSTPI